MPSSHLILCRPLLLLPPIPPSIRVFSNESTLRMRWPKYWSFSFSTSPSNEHPGLISFRMDWLDLLPVQGTLKRLLQHHSSTHPLVNCPFWNLQLFNLGLYQFPVEILTNTSGNMCHSHFEGDDTEPLKDNTQDSESRRNFKLDSHEFKYCGNLSKLLELLFFCVNHVNLFLAV